MRRVSVMAACWLAACSFESSYDGTRFQCEDDRGCPAGTSCSAEGYCEAHDGGAGEEVDAGPVDGPPALVAAVETTWTAGDLGGTKQTPELDVLEGDLLVAYAVTEDDDIVLASISGGGQNWSPPEVAVSEDHPWVGTWTATADADRSMTVSFTLDGDSEGMFGGGVLVFRGSGGVGTVVEATGSGSAAQVSLDTTRANSAVVVVVGDWSAQDGSAREWLEDAGALDETSYFRDGNAYAAYAGVHPDAGPADSYAIGLLGPDDLTYGMVVVEVLGAAAD